MRIITHIVSILLIMLTFCFVGFGIFLHERWPNIYIHPNLWVKILVDWGYTVIIIIPTLLFWNSLFVDVANKLRKN